MTDLSARELRIKIAEQVGFKPATILTKPHLNSIYAYLNGEFLIKPAELYMENQPGLLEMRKRVIRTVEGSYSPGPQETYPLGRPFSATELEQIYQAVKGSSDHRDYPEKRTSSFEWVEL